MVLQMRRLMWALVIHFSVSPLVFAEVRIEDASYPVIDTELEQPRDWFSLGAWLDEDRLIVNTFQDRPDARVDNLPRAVIFQMKTQQVRPFLGVGMVNCFDLKRRIVGLALQPRESDTATDGASSKITWRNGKPQSGFGLVNAAGELQILDSMTLPPTYTEWCRTKTPDLPTRALLSLLPEDGYIDLGTQGNIKRESKKAILYRPDQPPLKLSVIGGEISGAEFIPFLNKYLLNSSDPRRSYRPEIPYRLMSPDGEISEIPYPAQIAVRLGSFFDRVLITPSELMITKTGGGPGESGFFLIKPDRVVRFWGKQGDYAKGVTQSPSGCKLAFLSWRRLLWGESKRTVKIIDVCQGDSK